MRQTVALIGAAGKMGSRCTDNLIKEDYKLLLCEKSEAGLKKIQEKGLKTAPTEEAVPVADIIIMAVPDVLLSSIAEKMVPILKSDATVIMLDPAVAYVGGIPMRVDVTYVVTHPCHPPLFREQETPEARKDRFGGVAAIQDIVIALIEGSEENFKKAREVCCKMFSPVDKCHRITLEQMAILEPALSELIGCTAATILREAVDVAVDHGVPKEAAESFMLGHINIALAIAFGAVDADFSDAAKVAVNIGKDWVFKSDWKKVFKPEMVCKAIYFMLHPERGKK
ncbi:D-apionate oxidoisomerase [subsurface metagenome]|uniref:Semialdehyde dehydrogenase n=1 Tax=Aerophobetes bacterium TaxID=2030807 RepID=A0A523RND8_UNCAE|nr:MAG: hypothetical protein E3J84_07585 [Candidatus Aerophobetes bacterium]